MKHLVFGVFAHPDDETFPAGTLLKRVHAGAELHLVLATNGAGGANPDKHPDLGALRLEEWRTSGRLLGATSQVYWGYQDGELCNNLFHDLVARLEEAIISACHEPTHLEFITFDPAGVTGHIDHIVMSQVTSYVYERFKASPPRHVEALSLKYFCLSDIVMPAARTDFVYMPKGRPLDELQIEDIREFLEQKRVVMQAHHSQRADYEANIALFGERLGEECFILPAS